MNIKGPRILIVGEFRSAIHEPGLYEAMLKLGYNVDAFKTHRFFNQCSDLSYRFQYHFQFGFNVFKLNKHLRNKLKNNYDIIFLYRPRLLYKSTFKDIRKSKVFIYNNDDPFSKMYHFLYWYNFKKLLFIADHIFSYRVKNINDYNLRNFKNTSLLRSWYIERYNFHLNVEKSIDVVFIGHFENDERDKLFYYLLNSGVNLKIFGPGWGKSTYNKHKNFREAISPSLSEKDYNETLNKSKLAIVIFSKLNNDGYTRRCFEIPATKTPMIVRKTDEIISLFNQDEIILFETKEELASKIFYYLKNEKESNIIGQKCYERNLKSKNEVKDRAKQIIETYRMLS